MKRITRNIAIYVLMLTLMISISSCDKDDNSDASASSNIEASQETQDTASVTNPGQIIKTIENIDVEGDKNNEPLHMSSIILYGDGKVEIIPTDELKENELGNGEATSLFPFEQFGKVSDVIVVSYGEDGYRTVLALMEDGTIAAINGKALVEDHIITVAPNLTGREDYTSIEIIEDGDGTKTIIGHTKDNEEIILDNTVNFQ